MTDNTRKAIINKEIETYRKFAVVLESLKSVVWDFDGKCINKRFAEAMDEYLKYGKAERKYYVNAGISSTSYGNVFDICIRSYDDLVKEEPDGWGYCGSYRISNSECFLRVNAEDVTLLSAKGKPKIHAKALIGKFDEKIQCLNDLATQLETALNQVEEMRADLKQIKQLMAVFDGKYYGRVKEVFNCNYLLKDNSGIQYR